MAKFRFRLETLQKLRATHRDEMRTKLAEAYRAEQLLGEQVEAIHAEEIELQQIQRSSLQTADIDVNRLLNAQRYSAVLRGQLAVLTQQSQLLALEVEKRRQALVDADQQVRVLEKLYDRQKSAHRGQQLQNEAKALDEIGISCREVDG